MAFLLAKAKLIGGPIVVGIAFGASTGWYARGERATADNLATAVARLDSSTVKRPELERLVLRLDGVTIRLDSAIALQRRYICREQPVICP